MEKFVKRYEGKYTEEEPSVLPFDDVKESSWSYSDILYAYNNGLMNGVSGTSFAPAATTTRAMIVTILYRLEGSPKTSAENGFRDVKNGSWYTEPIIWANSEGIVTGYGGGKFGPDDPITREQMATILYRYTEYKGISTELTVTSMLGNYADLFKTGTWSRDAVMWALGTGLINGVTETIIAPANNSTREQVAAILHRYCIKFGEV